MVYLCCGLCQLAWLYWARESKIASPINLILRLGKAGMTWSWLSFSVFLHSLSPSQVIRLLCMASKKADSEAARHLKNWAGPWYHIKPITGGLLSARPKVAQIQG
jgi:hypothetical protein